MIRVLFCGSREWTDEQAIREMMITLRSQATSTLVVVHGAARGADSIASCVAKELGVVQHPYPAEWNVYGLSAGPIRNEAMLKSGIDLVVAFKNDFKGINRSGGTEHMCRIAKRDDVPVWLVAESPNTGLNVVAL